jgi:hypothetical protein
MKSSVVLPGYVGFCRWNNSNGKANHPLVKIRISLLLRYSAVPCSIFDIHQISTYAFILLRKGYGPVNPLGLTLIADREMW